MWSEWIVTKDHKPETGMYIQAEEGRRIRKYPPPAECIVEGICCTTPKPASDPTNGFIGRPKIVSGVRPYRPYSIRWRHLIQEDRATSKNKRELSHAE